MVSGDPRRIRRRCLSWRLGLKSIFLLTLLPNALSQALLAISATAPAPLAYTTVFIGTAFLGSGLFSPLAPVSPAFLPVADHALKGSSGLFRFPILESMRILLEASADA